MTPVSDLHVPGAKVAMCIGWEGRPTYVAAFDAERLEGLLAFYETRNELRPFHRDDDDAHWKQYKRLLKVVMDGTAGDVGDWLYPAGLGLLWCGFHHPALGEDLRRRASLMLREIKRATMVFEIRQGTLFFDLSEEPLPAMTVPDDGHGEPSGGTPDSQDGNALLTLSAPQA